MPDAGSARVWQRRSHAAELEDTNVSSFTIGPGQVMTPGLEEAVRDLAPMHAMSETDFLAMHAEHTISVAEAARRVRASFVGQVDGWRARGLFERKWMERDFRRHAGASPAEVIVELDRLVATLGQGVPIRAAVTARLLTYNDRYEKLARDHARDPVDLERALTAIAAWRADIVALDRHMHPRPSS